MHKFILVFLITHLFSIKSLAEEKALHTIYDNDSFAITFDNDVLTVNVRDRYYTNGVFFTYKNHYSYDSENLIYKYSRDILDLFMYKKELIDAKNSFQILASQQMITPEDIRELAPDISDQPYAGILYGQVDLFNVYKNQSQAISLLVGVSGPQSGAEAMQELVHELIGNDAPEGWDLQIPEKIFVNMSLQNNYRPYIKKWNYFSFDTALNWGVNVGNLETSGRVGFLLSFYETGKGDLMLDPSFGTSPSKLNFNRSNFEGFSLFSGTELTGIINSLINNSKFTIDNYTYIPRPYIYIKYSHRYSLWL